ncbi:NADH dehydrogenase subunit 4L (mitochondrion) [Saccoglossus kowalevskii]|uniref:NADH-ubiquinone oxidoreductase chain 4L n=1 Tax=Saccoglossus kowalevskii TaxID=10224 RepID=Q3L8T4_SACKO|nr:NADH dehydrogenase subunit 4L [Saccoglossus kowalevskii]AAQ92984.1 NADH dehydrogenase subunit 4L [Saccoglossus kowalevskii]
MSPFIILVIFSSILATLGLALNRSHLLSALLCLELLLISSFAGVALWANMTSNFPLLPASLLLITFSACEASAGLGLLVSISRTHGSDLIRSLNLLQC